MDKESTKRLTIKIARILDNKKADDVKIYDLLGLSSLCDYVIIATAASAPHLDALEREASVELKKENIYKTNRDGGNGGVWRVSDYGGFMLHIMTYSAREF
ncbi:MAG: ribosome silencing factor [Elusimicrobiota bacterium]|jgi:ribosome-associated protein|nr:ribosome silencing factor [Elusimicrobiota bacterium]